MDRALTIGVACAARAMIGAGFGNLFNRSVNGFALVGGGFGVLVGAYLASQI
jgi:hypothetical protein